MVCVWLHGGWINYLIDLVDLVDRNNLIDSGMSGWRRMWEWRQCDMHDMGAVFC